MAMAHEHAAEHIPDDAAVSPEPLVRLCGTRLSGQEEEGEEDEKDCSGHSDMLQLADKAVDYTGLDIMGAYLHQHDGLWRLVPHRHGARRE